jgi:hypothetical protein
MGAPPPYADADLTGDATPRRDRADRRVDVIPDSIGGRMSNPVVRVKTPAHRGDGGAAAAGASGAGEQPAVWHRGITILALVSMFVGTRSLWTSAILAIPVVAGVISLCYAAILILGCLTLAVRTRRALMAIDVSTLFFAVVLVVCYWAIHHHPGDEGSLTAQAAFEFVHGHAVYGSPWPFVFTREHVGMTFTMSGGADYTYGYPPLALICTTVVHAITGLSWVAAASAACIGALIAGCVTLWLLLPVPWRSAAIPVFFVALLNYAALGYPAIIALALMVPVIVRWPSTGAGGRLSRFDVFRALCLGAACAAQQLPWFLAPFLLVALYLVRRGELPTRRALAVVARYVALAVGMWVLINGYFIVRTPRAWATGIVEPLFQNAVPHGQGLVDVSLYFTSGSGNLAFYSYATVALGAGLLALTALFPRRIGPMIPVLPWCVFFLSIRSQDGYYLLMTPLWLAAAITAGPATCARAYQSRFMSNVGRPVRFAVAAALLIPAAIYVAAATTSSPPLRIAVTRVALAGAHSARIRQIDARIVNSSDAVLSPHFAISNSHSLSRYWNVISGPRRLEPGASATYRLESPRKNGYARGPGGLFLLRVVTSGPLTLSTANVP